MYIKLSIHYTVGKLHLKRAHDVYVVVISNRVFRVIVLTSDIVPKSERQSLGFLGYDKSAGGLFISAIHYKFEIKKYICSDIVISN